MLAVCYEGYLPNERLVFCVFFLLAFFCGLVCCDGCLRVVGFGGLEKSL
jgi:hypothetical protein